MTSSHPAKAEGGRAAGGAAAVIAIREASAADGEAVERLRGQLENLHARLLPDYFRPSSEMPHAVSAIGARAGEMTGASSGSHIWVGEADRVVRGYVIARIVDTPPDPAMVPARRVQIVELCVEAAFRRLGMGRRLMKKVEDWARDAGATETVLTVWSHNRAAFGLYGELGFQTLARIMRRALPAPRGPGAARRR